MIPVLLVLGLGWCTWWDWRFSRVPNLITLPPALLSLVWMLGWGGRSRWFFAVGLIILIGMLLRGWIGGADVKILASLLAFWPLGLVGGVLCLGLAAAGLLALRGRRVVFPAVPWLTAGAAMTLIVSNI